MKRHQLEISFENKSVCRRPSHRSRRMTRARWWFGQMRRVVEDTIEWQPASMAVAEQVFLPLPQVEKK